LFYSFIDEIAETFNIEEDIIKNKLDRLTELNDQDAFLKEMNIKFKRFEDLEFDIIDTVNVWYSISNLQRIPLKRIKYYFEIASEALKDTGIAYHKVDCSDIHAQPHYPFYAKSIYKLDYLEHSENAWKLLNNNEYGCQNRIRYPQYVTLFDGVGLFPVKSILYVDQKDIEYVKTLNVSESFSYMANEQLAICHFKIVLTKRKKDMDHGNKYYFKTSELVSM
jgi:hypothetical protein